MTAKATSNPVGMNRMDGLLAWWGFPDAIDNNELEAQANRCQALVVELNELFRNASSRQTQALSTANEEFSRALRELVSAREPGEVMAAQSSLLMALVSELVAQTGAWAELSQRLYDCCSAMARENAAAANERMSRNAPGTPKPDADQPRNAEAA